MRALVVEDDAATRHILARALEQRGHTVTSVEDAETALAHHQAEPFVLMLLDWQLPGMDGVELCRRVRAAPGGDDLAIVIITASTRPEDLFTALDAGANDYLVKPINVPVLRTRLIIAERLANDIARRREMRASLIVADRLASVGTLAAGVAHEINNPLAYVIANLECLAEELPVGVPATGSEGTSSLREMIKAARDGAERVRLIVRDLKTFSSDRTDEVGPVDVRRAIAIAIQMAWNQIKLRARLVKDYAEVPPVQANEARLGQVFLNLLMNAAQAIPEGSVDRNEIRIVTRLDDAGRVAVEVRDSGAGIAAEHLGHIFDPFFTTKPVGEGTGLGLSICHSIINGFKGEISVDSTPGRGTTFRVVLPAADLAAFARPLPASSSRQQPVGRRARVIVIDDEPLIGATVKRALGADHDVVSATSVREALEHFRSGQLFDVVLCDLMMPDVTGIDLYEELTRTVPRQATRMVFITGGAFTPRAQAFLAHVTNPRLEKPFDLQTLRTMVRQAILVTTSQEMPAVDVMKLAQP